MLHQSHVKDHMYFHIWQYMKSIKYDFLNLSYLCIGIIVFNILLPMSFMIFYIFYPICSWTNGELFVLFKKDEESY